MRQRNKDLLLAQPLLGNEFSYYGVTAPIAVLFAQALDDPNCCVPLFLEDVTC